MLSDSDTIPPMEKWNKYSYVCPDCDGLFSYTIKAFSVDYWECPNCKGHMTLMSVVDATIYPTQPKEEKTMETLEAESLAYQIKQELELTYGNEITELKNRLDAVSSTRDYFGSENLKLNNQIEVLKTYLVDNYDELEMHADEIATIMDIPLTKEVTYDVTMRARVTLTVGLNDDAEAIINDNLTVDAGWGDIEVEEYMVDMIEEA